ncbi:MAG TPA: hypothetical protein VFN62_10385, partial [Acidobacteriaceae bacterium]|nr:hypothetical protein [Acidobacteriaceae bacterium]
KSLACVVEVYIILCMYGPPRECKRKMKVTGWSAQMYTVFVEQRTPDQHGMRRALLLFNS